MNYSNIDSRISRKVVFTPEKMRDLRRRVRKAIAKSHSSQRKSTGRSA